MPARFTICVLHYGDYPDLARRVMEPLRRDWMPHLDLRVGTNAIGAATRSYLEEYQQRWTGEWLWIDRVNNDFKYPVMRALFASRDLRPYCMWFDDDSCILPTAPASWFAQVAAQLASAAMVGSIWTKRVRPEQRKFYEQQPWYRGKPVLSRVNFVTGGWWAIRSEILLRFNWPPPDMQHTGGDMALGELCRQNNLFLKKFDSHLAINADASLKCSSAKRRGISRPDYGAAGWQRPGA
jgi:hypothetical protein